MYSKVIIIKYEGYTFLSSVTAYQTVGVQNDLEVENLLSEPRSGKAQLSGGVGDACHKPACSFKLDATKNENNSGRTGGTSLFSPTVKQTFS